MKIKAAVLHQQDNSRPFAQSRPFSIEEVDLDGPGPGEVLVEVRAAGICHSDLSVLKGLRKRRLPVVGGHEAAGIVRETGKGVVGLTPGDHVIMTVVAGCGECDYCRQDWPALCTGVSMARAQGLLSNGERRLSRNGTPLYHYSGISGFAEYAVCMENSLVRIDPAVPLDIAAMFGCAVVTGVGAVFNTAAVAPGNTVVVNGLGGVGLNSIMAAKLAGASRIVGIDIRADKFPLAAELGATDLFNATDPDLVSKVTQATGGGAHYLFEMSAAKPAITMATDLVRPRGEVICVGLGATNDLYEFKHTPMAAAEKCIRGCVMGSCVPSRDIPQYVDHFLTGKLPVDRLRSDYITFDDLNEAFDRLADGNTIRQILLPHGSL
ncbi:zinc-binding dehydrogenase [Gemmobacter sp.]|uniref:zinc-binding dehydrogenase n=1 Tax=Gemmobacter sp. TaxID=1898957 RepID=UPI002AFF65FD|nr:zinc-binding dehydrogenase [Gemmobacter sp.]